MESVFFGGASFFSSDHPRLHGERYRWARSIARRLLLERVLKDFKEHPKAQPKKRKALIAKVANLINKKVDGLEVQAVIARMVEAGKLKFGEKDVPEYHLK